jgi:hypothetical protein
MISKPQMRPTTIFGGNNFGCPATAIGAELVRIMV